MVKGEINLDILSDIKKLKFEDAVKVLDNLYTERYTIPQYYEAYSFVCEKFNHRSALLPHREYRQKVWS